MGGFKNPPNGSLPLLNLQNVQIHTEPNCPAAADENALSDFAPFRNPATFFEDLPRKLDGRSVLCEGFSIREYVAKVRSVDIRKCWPLSESLLEDSLREGRKPPLPPLVRPNYRWWSCHQGLGMFGEHKHYEVFFDRCNSLSIELPENNSQNYHIIEQNRTVSLDTDPETGAGISQDLDKQIRKLSTVKISGQNWLNIARSCEDAIKDIEDKSERVDKELVEVRGQNIIVPSCIRESDNQTQAKNSTFDLIERVGDLLNDVGRNGKEMEKAMRVPDETADQAGTQSVSLECEGSKIDSPISELTKIVSRKANHFDVGNSECSGVKICPVCTTFTSATITAVNAHIDNCLAQVSKTQKKQKSRARKKRSIVDICAASPPVQMSLEYLENFQMDDDTNESAGSHGMHSKSKLAVEVRANGALTEDMNSIQTSSEAATQDDSSTVKCKRKQPAEAHYSTESEKSTNGDGQPESLETKRRRQRLGIITCVLGSKDLKRIFGCYNRH